MDDRSNQDSGDGWEHFDHGADIGVRGTGATPAQAFANAALALTAVVTDPGTVHPVEPVQVTCSAPNLELLLCDWLNALVYEMATRRMLFARFDVAIDARGTLIATAWGEPVDLARHRPAVEVKGATMTALHVGVDTDGRWQAECVVDV